MHHLLDIGDFVFQLGYHLCELLRLLHHAFQRL